ncbi:hypothetical protein FRC12_017123 [Ceratobasidium sp. 428]|nr:hypothetical protein FRC12_017123 [Ceratobasidium sp. 428]
MAHPLEWPSDPKFFPIGVLPATSLTQDLSPEQSADILLLGCGDPRHILYTVSTDVTCPPVPRKLDITCCDLEPGILARNILLYTLLEDDVPSNHIWDIFYHFKVGDHAFGLIQSQSRKLVELSESPESWRQSKYGSFLKMVTATSLSELRNYWSKYADFADLPTERLDRLREEYESLSKKRSKRPEGAVYQDASRSAANSWKEAVEPVSDQFAHYWEHGTTVTTSEELKKITKLNPTFFYSFLGESFDVYMSTFPQGYHFAPAFTPLISDPAGPTTNSAMLKAKQQFKAGLSGFQMSRKAKSIVLRFFVGDALALCRALDQYAKTQKTDIGEFTAPWRATMIDLSEHAASSPRAPRSFDVIDASSLDHDLGIFNILLLAQPLLKTRPASQAVLYTDTSLMRDKTEFVFHERICHSIVTAGILIGLAPRPYLSLFTASSITHELMMPRSSHSYVERIAWVDPTSGDAYTYSEPSRRTPHFDVKELLQLLAGICDTYFTYDRLTLDDVLQMHQRTADSLEFFSNAHYSREFIAALLAHIMTRFCLTSTGEWDTLSNLLLDVLAQYANKPFLDLSHELEVHHLLRGLPFKKTEAELSEDVARSEVFKNWTDPIPKLVCVVLIVPWNKLELLRKDQSSPSPRLVCNLIDPNAGQPKTTASESVQAAWGKCVPLEGSDGTYIIKEGSPAFRHDSGSDLILSFWANAELLTPAELTVSLSLLHTPLARYKYRDELGEALTLFSTNIADKDHVLVLKNRPTSNPQPQHAHRIVAPVPMVDNGSPCNITVIGSVKGGSQIREMRARVQVKSKSDKAALAKGVKGSIEQLGPCTLQVDFARWAYTVKFPFPILESRARVEMHTESHEIEVVAHISTELPTQAGGYPVNPFPVLHHTTPSPWNIHHVHPQRLPLVDIQQRDRIKWLIDHTTAQMSDRERIVQRSSHSTKRTPDEVLVTVKESLMTMMLDYVGLRQGPVKIFALTDTMHGYNCFIFVLGLRLDLAGGTVILDTALVPIHLKGAKKMSPALTILNNSGQALMQVRTRHYEGIAWKHLLPAFVERCRTWSHKAKCEYKATGKIPLGVEPEVNPLCSCGQGVGLDGPEWNDPAWKAVLPFATRAAISPLFGVSYLEEMIGPAAKVTGTQVPTSVNELQDVCWQCDGIDVRQGLLRCQRCKKARYCSKKCQELHWKADHKYNCKPA